MPKWPKRSETAARMPTNNASALLAATGNEPLSVHKFLVDAFQPLFGERRCVLRSYAKTVRHHINDPCVDDKTRRCIPSILSIRHLNYD